MSDQIEMTPDQVYDALYQSVGDGLRAPQGSIVEEWRHARAEGLSAVTVDWRAFLQTFPNHATDFIPVYEDILGMQLDPSWTTEEKQQALALRWTSAPDASGSSLTEQLEAIDPRFSIADPGLAGAEYSTVTESGARAFEDWNIFSPLVCGPAFDLGRSHTLFPNYSTDFITPVLFDLGGAPPTADEMRLYGLAADQLNAALPAWVDFRLYGDIGFVLDEDLLDFTVFGADP